MGVGDGVGQLARRDSGVPEKPNGDAVNEVASAERDSKPRRPPSPSRYVAKLARHTIKYAAVKNERHRSARHGEYPHQT